MSWATITTDQFVAEGFNPDEREDLQRAAGGGDDIASIITFAIAEWRGLMSAAGNALDADASTIPPNCRRHIIAQCRWQLLIKFPALKALQTDPRKEAAKRAEDILDMIAKGTFPIEPPTEEDASLTGGSSGGQTRIPMTRDDQVSYDP